MGEMNLPLGLGMALAQNEEAMKAFESLSEAEKSSFLERTRNVRSKKEMQQLVTGLPGIQTGWPTV